MRIAASILAVVVGTFLLVPARAQDKQGKPEAQKSVDKVQELQKERLDTLKAMADIETALHRNGKTSPDAMLEARVQICDAELDVAEKESDRIAALQRLVVVLKELEGVAKARKQAAEGTEAAVLRIKARRLEAEIRLERARAKAPSQAKRAEPKSGPVVVTSTRAKDVVATEQFIGQIRSRRHIDVRSLQSGYVEEVSIREGQAVKQGDVLFKVTSLLYKARLEAEQAQVEIAALNLKNTERLLQNKVVSQDEVALLRAKLASAQAKANLARAELELTVVRAPFDGIVDRLQQHQGSLVTEREVLTTLSDNSVMWVYFQVSQADYLAWMADPAKDQERAAELVLADGRKLPQPGKIAAIEAQFDDETGTIPFRADFPNPDGLLRHGMTGNVLIHHTLKDALVIPQRATFEVLGKRYVYVVSKDDVAQRREIAIERELADDFVIKQGLSVNDRIVVEGVGQTRDGEKLEYELPRP